MLLSAGLTGTEATSKLTQVFADLLRTLRTLGLSFLLVIDHPRGPRGHLQFLAVWFCSQPLSQPGSLLHQSQEWRKSLE